MAVVTLEGDAYVTLFLHACKHSSKAVNGLLLGRVDGENNVTLLKALPLFHSSFALSPMLEVALMLVRAPPPCLPPRVAAHCAREVVVEDGRSATRGTK